MRLWNRGQVRVGQGMGGQVGQEAAGQVRALGQGTGRVGRWDKMQVRQVRALGQGTGRGGKVGQDAGKTGEGIGTGNR